MRLIKIITDSGRATYLNLEQIVYVGADPANEARTELMTAEGGIYFSKKAVEVIVAALSDPKTKEI